MSPLTTLLSSNLIIQGLAEFDRNEILDLPQNESMVDEFDR